MGAGTRPLLTITDIHCEKLYDDVELPALATQGSAAADARAYIKERSIACRSEANLEYHLAATTDPAFPDRWFITLHPGHRALIGLGFKARIPEGYEVQVRSRSGLVWKQGIVVANAPGTIDSDFANEWMVILRNTSTVPFELVHGERIAQLMTGSTYSGSFDYVEGSVERTTERDGGFGSTGVK